jgi:hypothetical protein
MRSEYLSKQVQVVFTCLDRKEVVDLALKLGDTPSPTGHEKEVGEFELMLRWIPLLVDNPPKPWRRRVSHGGTTGSPLGLHHGMSKLR